MLNFFFIRGPMSEEQLNEESASNTTGDKAYNRASNKACLVVGNWKMYKTINEALSFIEDIAKKAADSSCKVMLAVPFTAIKSCADKARGTSVIIGAQNMNDAEAGAFTGEVAAFMLKDAGAEFVILGHSERRRLFGETNAFINRKIKRAQEAKLEPILCVGETFEERNLNHTEEVLKQQLQECLEGVESEEAKHLSISYEPVWAIGTGKAALPDVVESVHSFIRGVLTEKFGEEAAKKIPLLYGGSVTANNADAYLREKNIDGLLIGSASLQAETFAKIIELRHNITKTNCETSI
jgi:triosephosphate isomerase (TIM)